ncbi:unnamed protein product [Phytophthora lilii]|uniref:Unnamed protein product n=1 Tax=Phytophthora lilii TaxID=2077276 RepID=A0A9W6TQX7_9STRA|nr:unnamed protein product [Phytophthora lilii]
MLDKSGSTRRASQPLVFTPSTTNQASIRRSSSFLLTGFKGFRGPRTKHSNTEEVVIQHKEQRDSNSSARRISTGPGPSDDDDEVIDLFTTSTRSQNQSDHEFRRCGGDNNSGEDTDDAEASSGSKSSLRLWQRFSPKQKSETNKATTMYSISFYPWKMEPHGYYSHPEAAANWVPDTASARCQICLAAFTLIRRRHHCRLCGHLVCTNCSHDRTYLPFAGSAPSQHRLIKDGAPQRTCSSCASTLRNMAAQDDSRVKRFTVAVSSVRRRKSTASATSISSSRSVVEVEVERPSPWLRRTGMALTNSDIEDEEFFIESTKALQHDNRSRGTTHHFPLRLSVTRAEELDEILSARASSRVRSAVDRSEIPGSRQFVISSAWLDQWLQYVRVDSASADAAVSHSSTTKLSRGNFVGAHRSKRMARPPRPGPVTNYALLDFVNGELVPKPNLQRSKGSHGGGDYRVVSQEVWVTFLELYGGGPSIQVPLNNDADVSNRALLSNNQFQSPRRRVKLPQWIISELDDSLPALAASPSSETFTPATRKGAARVRDNQSSIKTVQDDGENVSRSTSRKRLISTASMSSLVKKTTGCLQLRCESPPSNLPSRWKLWEERRSRARADTMICERTAVNSASASIDDCNLRNTTCDASSTLAAVSAFASAATLARQRSAISLSRHSAAISRRANGSVLEAR